MKKIDFEKWLEINEDELNCIFAESGADREMDFDRENSEVDLYESNENKYDLINTQEELEKHLIDNEVRELVKILKAAKEAYYTKTEESSADLMSDETYDELETRLEKLDPDNEFFQTVGTNSDNVKESHFISKGHTLKMGSQNKVQSKEDYEKWSKDKGVDNEPVCVSEKADGSSLAITYTRSGTEMLKNLKEVYNHMKNYLESGLGKSKSKDKDIEYKLKQLETNKDNLKIQFENNSGNKFGVKSAVTRGDGVLGEDITLNAYKFQNLKEGIDIFDLFDEKDSSKILDIDGNHFKLEDIERFEIRGEVIIKEKDYNEVSKEKTYKNMRNAVAGIMRRQDSNYQDKLSLLSYNLILVDFEGHEIHFNDDTQFKLLEKANFDVTNYFVAKNMKEVTKEYEAYKKTKRKKLDYIIDGLVVKINDKDKRNELGITNQRPNGEVAIKFEHQIKMTTIRDIKYYFGKSGVITPVGYVNAVDIDGTTVENASLSNKERLYGMLLKPGTPVMVSRRNDVIPKIEENMDVKVQKVYTQVFKIINENMDLLNDEEKKELNDFMTNNNYEFKLEINNSLLKFNQNGFSIEDFISDIDVKFLKGKMDINTNNYKDVTIDIDKTFIKDEILDNTFNFISHCPKCNSKLIKDNASYKCMNNECSGVKIGKMIKFTEDIDGLGEGIMNQLNDYDISQSVVDLFKLKKEDFKNIQNKKELFNKYYKKDLLDLLEDTLSFDLNLPNVSKELIDESEIELNNKKEGLEVIITLPNDGRFINYDGDTITNSMDNKFNKYQSETNKEIIINDSFSEKIYFEVSNTELENSYPKEIVVDFHEGWKTSKINNTLKAIKKLGKCSDAEFMGRFGFNNMGESRFLSLFQEIDFEELKNIKNISLNYEEKTMKTKEKFIEYVKNQNLDSVIEKTIIDIVNIEGMAGKSTTLLINEFSQRRKEVLDTLKYVETTTTPKVDKNSIKHTVCITGSINPSDNWKDRATMTKFLKGKGHTVSNPSSKTDFIITDSPVDSITTNAKYKKAKSLEAERGTKVLLTSEEFIQVLNGKTLETSNNMEI